MLNLTNIPLLCSLPEPALAALQAAAVERRFLAGSEIFKEGDAGDGLYFVQEGRVEISGAIGPGQRHVFAHRSAVPEPLYQLTWTRGRTPRGGMS